MDKYRAISLFSGAGGMDIGFERAGIEIVCANEIVTAAAETYIANHKGKMIIGDINEKMKEFPETGIDIVFGGPPCQGFSVAGKMDITDPRSQMIFRFLDVVQRCRPKTFVMENVKALAALNKWEPVRQAFFDRTTSLGYTCFPFVCLATDYGVPQKRERVFFVGVKGEHDFQDIFAEELRRQEKTASTVKEVLRDLGRAGTGKNPNTCKAKITFVKNPVLRKTAYAGMIYNGAGRPINVDGYANTLPASMGGNKTPIVDENHLYGYTVYDWNVRYYEDLLKGVRPIIPAPPNYVRRLTINEAARLQSFPDDYKWCGKNSAIYKQIGNAVPPMMAEAIALALLGTLTKIL